MHALLFSPDRTADWIETLLTIENERGEVVDFKLYPQQRQMLAGHTGRDVTVKGRQTRASSLILARNLRRLTTSFGLKALVMTQDDQTTMLFRDRIRHHLRDLSNHGFDYPLVADNKDEMVIGREMQNHILFGSGEERVAGRAYAAQIVHLCVGADTLVRTRDGFLERIVEARGGTTTHGGHRAEIRSLSYAGERQMVRVRLPGEEILCTPDHRFWTDEGWCAAKDMTDRWVGIPRRWVGRRRNGYWSMELGREAKGQLAPRIPLTQHFGFVVGMFLAEGSCFRAGIQFSLHRAEGETAKRIASVLRPHSQSIRIDWTPKRPNNLNVVVYSTDLRRLFERELYRRDDKALPDSLFHAPRPFLKGLIRGYIEGDGNPHSETRHLSVVSTRPQLLTQLQDLVLALHGWWGPIYRGERSRYGKKTQDGWVLVYQGPTNEAIRKSYGWQLPEGRQCYKHRTHRGRVRQAGEPCLYRWIKVTSVEEAGVHGAYDLVLDHEDHSFRTLAASVHNSEIAHWKPENAGELLGGITPSVPGPPVGWFDMESTPNGAAGQFYDYCMDARDKDDLLQRWSLHFYPWWLEPRYRAGIVGEKDCDLQLPPNELERLRMGFKPDNHESFLVDHHDLSVDQLIWRRWRERELLRTGVPFLQEYVEDVDSCFITGEGNFFASPDGLDHLAYYKAQTANPGFKLDELPYKDSKISFYGPHLHVWERPDPVQVYVAYLDCAEGGVGRENDYTALVVLNAFTRHHAATLRLRAAPTECGMMAAAVAQWYNKALLGGERGTYGSAALERIRDLRYPNIYYHVDYDKPNKPPEPWIYPTQAHRDEMLRVFREAIFERTFMTRDDDLVKEMGSFSWEKVRGGQIKAKAAKRKHDDLVIAASGATFLCRRYARHQMDREPQRETIITGPTGVVIGRDVGGSTPLPWLK